MSITDAEKTSSEDAKSAEISTFETVEAERGEDGIWRTPAGRPLRVSASDLERYAYCPLSWQLSRSGVSGVGHAVEEGVKKHAEIHAVVEEYEGARRKAKRELIVWSWWFGIIVAITIDSVAFFSIDKALPPTQLARYLVLLGIVWLFLGIILTTIPWRKWVNLPEPKTRDTEDFEQWDMDFIKPVVQQSGFIGGWAEAGRTEAALFFGAIITSLHGAALWRADDREQAGYILLMVALLWTFFASWRLQRVLLADNEAEQARHEAGFESDVEVAYSDDSESSDLLQDKTTGLRGRPDQIVIIDGEFIPVEVKTGKVPTRPHFSHTMQVLAYLHLVGKNTGRIPPYGILRYGKDSIFQIDWDEENQTILNESLIEVQRLSVEGGASRNHDRPGKCRNCSRRHACPESLA